MKYFFDDLDRLKVPLTRGPLFLFLDFDGTLAPIVDRPENAALPAATKDLLQSFVRSNVGMVAIVSGRGLDNVKAKVGIDDIIYVGNHGFEIQGKDIPAEAFDIDAVRKLYDVLKKEFKSVCVSFPGVILEDKGATISVHFRLVQAGRENDFQEKLLHLTEAYVARGELIVNLGKKVFEIKPAIECNKGTAVLKLIHHYQKTFSEKMTVLYIGDDRTDEDAFRVLGPEGVSIKVGEGESQAKYFLKNQKEVIRVLSDLWSLRTMKGSP